MTVPADWLQNSLLKIETMPRGEFLRAMHKASGGNMKKEVWAASKSDRSIGPVSKEDDQSYGMVIPVAWVEYNLDQEDQDRVTRLIASAPEMLSALQGILKWNEDFHGDDRDYHEDHPLAKAHSVVAKARGG